MNIAICSGKGGTGKTTFALSLAWTLAKAEEFKMPVRLLDADVEEPNCHLFLKNRAVKCQVVHADKPEFLLNECIGCGRCANKCRYNAIAVVKGKPIVFNDMCHSCGVCAAVCPKDAVVMKQVPIGEIETSQNHHPFSFAMGRLNIGESQSPMILSALQMQTLPEGLNIYDGPPGTACNAVKAISQVEKVLLVTEPTPFGAHDLALSLDLCYQLGKPCAIAINRSDSGDFIVEDIAEKYGVSIVGRVPFSREYARACSDGIILAAEFPTLRQPFIECFSQLLSCAVLPQPPEKVCTANIPQELKKETATTAYEAYQEVTILSGKGGTGKTTVTGGLIALAESKIFADCDVDAANLRLIFKEKPLFESKVTLGMAASINEKLCIGCQRCLQECRFDAIEKTDAGKCAVRDINCEGCGLCIEICPAKAIVETRCETGVLKLSETDHGLLAHANLATAAENSGKLVSMVRDLAFSITEEKKKEWLLVDGPPGTACPAIASVTGSDRVILVTEPTVAAVHDLERIIRLVCHFGIKPEIIINKADLNHVITSMIKDMALSKGYRVLGEIPFDESVKESIKAGRPLTSFNDGPASMALKEIWTKIKETRK